MPDPNLVHEGTEVRGAKHFRIHGLGKELKDLGLIGCKSKDKFIQTNYKIFARKSQSKHRCKKNK